MKYITQNKCHVMNSRGHVVNCLLRETTHWGLITLHDAHDLKAYNITLYTIGYDIDNANLY